MNEEKELTREQVLWLKNWTRGVEVYQDRKTDGHPRYWVIKPREELRCGEYFRSGSLGQAIDDAREAVRKMLTLRPDIARAAEEIGLIDS